MAERALTGFVRNRYTMTFVALLFVAVSVGAFYYVKAREQGKEPSVAEIPAQAAQTAQSVLEQIPEFKEIVGRFEPNENITSVLLKQGLSSEQVHAIVECARPVYNLAKVKSRQLYYLYFTNDGEFRDFRYPIDREKYLTVYHDVREDRMVPVVKDFQFDVTVETVNGTINSSLFATVSNIGEKDQLALDLAEIFASDIDFHTDIQKGDSFKALIEKRYLDGDFTGYGAVLAASFINNGKEFTGFRFEDENGKPAYYARDGKSLKKSFLKSPLKYARISSGFSLARRHPVLKVVRPHLGVDYAAPTGTPVQAVGDGVVISAGYSGGNGNMVKIRHAHGYQTMYLHLSRIAVKRGARVSQGQVIGNVGSTGLSTGPHLDFRVYRNGKALNPLKVISPPGEPVSKERFASFAAVRDSLEKQLRDAGGAPEILQADVK